MVSFVILNYNSSELVRKCVASIEAYMPADSYEMIVVDNGSRPDEYARLDGLSSVKDPEKSRLHIVRKEVNTGFGTGNMIGASVAQGDYLCFLNSDVFLVEDCVTPLCQYLESHTDVGCITPVQQKTSGRRSRSFRHDTGIWHELVGDSIRERLFPKKFPPRDSILKESTEPVSVMQINGSFMLFPTEKFWAIGGFDTSIFLYYEEYDLAQRLQMHGWKRVVHPQYTFLHVHDASTSAMRKLALRENYVSKIYTYKKYHGLLTSFIYQAILTLQLVFKPKKWYILPTVTSRHVLAHSMRHQADGHKG
ncbi:MAG: glycosyltransferase family 2 protein [Prevotella sp.]|nr:glycosyltransferase family 2 protein [Prevotella sp.]